MLCGSPQMLEDMRTVLEERGFDEGSSQRARHVRGREGLRRTLIASCVLLALGMPGDLRCTCGCVRLLCALRRNIL